MQNMETILKELGIELTDEQKTSLKTSVEENYKPIADWQKQVDKVTSLKGKVTATEEALKAFEGVDPTDLNRQITELQEDLAQKDADYAMQLADRDFNELLKDNIAASNGKNAKAITALLDMDVLKASKNQKEDIVAALKTLTEAEDSKMLFGESEPTVVETGSIIGKVTKPSVNAEDNAMRAAMGLSPMAEQK